MYPPSYTAEGRFPQHEGNLRNHLKAAGLDSEAPLHDLVKQDKVRDIVFKELLESGKRGGLKGVEILQGVVLDDGPWTSENGCLTAAQKLNRHFVLKKYSKEIKVSNQATARLKG